jgi:diguanylate cyclase (GGDEF)-like protein
MILTASTGAINMVDRYKIGIVYKDRAPQFLENTALEGTHWDIETFQENWVRTGPVKPLKDYLAIFFSVDYEASGIRRQISNMFPGAELVGYRVSGKYPAGSLEKMEDGLSVVRLPASSQLIRFLFENLHAVKTCHRELIRAQLHLDNVQEFFNTFIETVESSSDLSNRKQCIGLLVNKILAHVQADECLIYVSGDSESALKREYSTGNINDIDLFEQSANRSIIEEVLVSGMPYVNNDYFFELKAPFSKESIFIRSILCYPLIRRGEKVGVIELLNKVKGNFTQESRALIEMVLDPLAVAIRTVDQFEKSECLTITDDLTKLYNYRYLKKFLEADVKRCLRYKKKVSLLFIDIDGFKQINDTFGHLVGSQALAEMGLVLKRMVREMDVVGRYGGDEFIIILPDTPLNEAAVIAERIRKKVEECEFVAQNLSIRLTVSLGVANCPKHTLTAEGLIKKADAAMYRAKELSKNSIKVAV